MSVEFIYKVGDEVILLDGESIEEGYCKQDGSHRMSPGFAYSMRKYIGESVEIVEVMESFTPRIPIYKVATSDHHAFWCMEDWLSPVYGLQSDDLDKLFEEVSK